LRFGKLPAPSVEWEIDKGIIDVGSALGDPNAVAPFFRVPGLARSEIIDSELSARLLVNFSSDVEADDWHPRISPKKNHHAGREPNTGRGAAISLACRKSFRTDSKCRTAVQLRDEDWSDPCRG
jgi:hypothetical protein